LRRARTPYSANLRLESGCIPGAAAPSASPPLVGRGRALEIILGANDFDGDTAALYGYVNRALPDDELDGFVDAAGASDRHLRRALNRGCKALVNQVSLPSADNLLSALNSFQTALTWPETLQRVEALLKHGLQRDRNFERNGPQCSTRSLEK